MMAGAEPGGKDQARGESLAGVLSQPWQVRHRVVDSDSVQE